MLNKEKWSVIHKILPILLNVDMSKHVPFVSFPLGCKLHNDKGFYIILPLLCSLHLQLCRTQKSHLMIVYEVN